MIELSDLKDGAIVKVMAYGDEIITRRCAGVRGQVALICSEQEWQAAQREQREPICTGFQAFNVVEIVKEAGEGEK